MVIKYFVVAQSPFSKGILVRSFFLRNEVLLCHHLKVQLLTATRLLVAIATRLHKCRFVGEADDHNHNKAAIDFCESNKISMDSQKFAHMNLNNEHRPLSNTTTSTNTQPTRDELHNDGESSKLPPPAARQQHQRGRY